MDNEKLIALVELFEQISAEIKRDDAKHDYNFMAGYVAFRFAAALRALAQKDNQA